MKVVIHGLAHSFRRCTDGPHGTPCDVCREAHRRYKQRCRDDARARLAADPSIRPHGNATTYQHWGCRCEACAKAGYEKRRQFAPYTNRKNGGRRRSTTQPFGREWLDAEG